MSNFVNQHRAIGVLLHRYALRCKNSRMTLNGFIHYMKSHKDVKTQFNTYGVRCLRKSLSHSLRSGAYPDFTMSKGEGIVKRMGYTKQTHLSEFTPTKTQMQRLGL